MSGTYFGVLNLVSRSVDCIIEYDDELAIIDFKTSENPRNVSGLKTTSVQCSIMLVCCMS